MSFKVNTSIKRNLILQNDFAIVTSTAQANIAIEINAIANQNLIVLTRTVEENVAPDYDLVTKFNATSVAKLNIPINPYRLPHALQNSGIQQLS
jgi:hypothetical protein